MHSRMTEMPVTPCQEMAETRLTPCACGWRNCQSCHAREMAELEVMPH
ncbi:hypothetical protein L195_g051135 [Trifolium pratense]|uniref:Uncharacterized protein n=1 Tax=Trifolium pratense TaxID=57577 RepID=A0A2K3JXV8_TRIPR|nr:hypothetical protein L195_g051135 [Trifolium pratense]